MSLRQGFNSSSAERRRHQMIAAISHNHTCLIGMIIAYGRLLRLRFRPARD
jgi:hypothetical protein